MKEGPKHVDDTVAELMLQADYFFGQEHLTSSEHCYLLALKKPHISVSDIGMAKLRLAHIYGRVGAAVLAKRYALEAVEIVNDPGGICFLGDALALIGEYQDAVIYYDRAIALLRAMDAEPPYVLSFSRSKALKALGDLAGAREYMESWIHVPAEDGSKVGDTLFHSKMFLANLIYELRDYPASIAMYREILSESPPAAPVPNILYNIALSQIQLGQIDDAIESLTESYQLRNDIPEVYTALAVLYGKKQKTEKALDMRRTAYELATWRPSTAAAYLFALLNAAEWKKAQNLSAEVSSTITRFQWAENPEDSVHIHEALHLPPSVIAEGTLANILKISVKHSTKKLLDTPETQRHLHAFWPALTQDSSPLRVGYLLPKIKGTPAGHLIHRMFKHHNRHNVQPVCFLSFAEQSEWVTYITETCGKVVDLSIYKDNDAAAAIAIAKEQLNILVDFSAWTRGAHTPGLARRPAPVQVVYLDFPVSTRADFEQYFFFRRSCCASP
eukprot:TRINITY_DN831_c0_g1_i1.p1 TRINITY_DN831_c0_g1~~TRINITY_DN831_c0_g1_i1.p1  ORF type:complete len:555 (+),score=95.16 TRINITY_DN831_c0_g1_i1:163-1665(+)